MPPHWDVRDVKKLSELKKALEGFWRDDER
jgi:hypothetical protein